MFPRRFSFIHLPHRSRMLAGNEVERASVMLHEWRGDQSNVLLHVQHNSAELISGLGPSTKFGRRRACANFPWAMTRRARQTARSSSSCSNLGKSYSATMNVGLQRSSTEFVIYILQRLIGKWKNTIFRTILAPDKFHYWVEGESLILTS